MKPILGIFLGEAAGVGPEIIAKLVAEKVMQEYCRPVLIGDARVLQLGQKIAKVDFPFVRVSHVKEINWEGPVSILDFPQSSGHQISFSVLHIEVFQYAPRVAL